MLGDLHSAWIIKQEMTRTRTRARHSIGKRAGRVCGSDIHTLACSALAHCSAESCVLGCRLAP